MIKEVDELNVWVLVDHLTDALSSKWDSEISEKEQLIRRGEREIRGEMTCRAHWGLSLWIRALVGKQSYTLLFDGGCDGSVLQRNAALLGLDFGTLDAAVLSHGHFDHAQGMMTAVELAKIRNRSVPLYVHPDAFKRRGIQMPDETILALAEIPSLDDLERAGAHIHTNRQSDIILDDTFYISGEVPLVTDFESGLSTHMKQENNQWTSEPWIKDERFLAVRIKGKGIVVFTGCAHPGIINILKHAQEIFGSIPLYAIIGGLHLVGPNEKVIPETVDALREIGMQKILAGHCTGWRGFCAIYRSFGEQGSTPLTVGSCHKL